MNINDDFKEILDYAHMWNWAPDISLMQEIYNKFDNSYSILTPFAYCYLEELIRSTTSEYGKEFLDKDGKSKMRKLGIGLIKLAQDENKGNTEYIKLLDEIKEYYKQSTPLDSGNNRNSVDHGYMHPRFWTQESFEKLIWFLGYLLIISLMLLPLLVLLARRAPDPSKLNAAVLFLPALPLGLYLAAFDGYWPFLPNLIGDWTNFFYFAMYMTFGAMIAAWPGIDVQLRAQAPRFAVLMALAFAGVAYFGVSTPGRVFVGLTAWFCVCAALGFAIRFKPAVATPALTYLAAATLPVYIIHHAVLLLIGVEVMNLPLPVWSKVTVILLATVAVSLAIYHWLIRPWRPMRWLLGMSTAPAAASRAPDSAAAKPALSQ